MFFLVRRCTDKSYLLRFTCMISLRPDLPAVPRGYMAGGLCMRQVDVVATGTERFVDFVGYWGLDVP